jgi:hypothetical protein
MLKIADLAPLPVRSDVLEADKQAPEVDPSMMTRCMTSIL